MEHLSQIIQEQLDMDFIYMIISNARHSQDISKIKIRPILLKHILYFQVSKYKGKQVLHSNETKEDVVELITQWLLTDFKQMELVTVSRTTTAMISKKGKATIKIKDIGSKRTQDLSHNRVKEYILSEGTPVDFLIELGVMTREGKVVSSKYDKFRQINRFLEFIEDILPSLPKGREITIIDFGCGKSYLTFAMYYYLKILKEYDINVIGLDLKTDVIKHCNKLSTKYGYDKLNFYEGDIESYEGVNQVDMVVTLHACDTATDYALAKAVNWGASVILSVPCCQHELNGQLKSETLSPILGYGLIKERFAALATDSLRAYLLEMQGYRTQILEFIDMEHTPKNILIRAVKGQKKADLQKEYLQCKEFLGVEPTLEKLFSIKDVKK